MRKTRQIFVPHSLSRRKQRKTLIAVVAGIGLCTLLLGGTILARNYNLGSVAGWLPFLNYNSIKPEDRGNTPTLRLVSLPAAQRAEQLKAIAKGEKSLERSRARYILAADAIAAKQGKEALTWLDGLDKDYPILSGYITLQKARSYELIGDKSQALAAWQDLLKHHSNKPVAAEALYALAAKTSKYLDSTLTASTNQSGVMEKFQHFSAISPKDPKYWENAIAKYPSHPLILELAKAKIEKDPAQPELMSILTRYAFDQPKITKILDQFVAQYGKTGEDKDKAIISPKDWEAIAIGYWKAKKYGQASAAYAKTEPTSRHAYLAALGLEYAEKRGEAKLAYQKVVEEFPRATESFDALVKIAKIEPDIEAVPYLDQAIDRFPDRAGEAVIVKAETLERLSSQQAAEVARELLLTKYSKSPAGAAYQWKLARAKAAGGDPKSALQLAQTITKNNPDSFLARQAGYWAGKWANKLGQKQEAKAAFEQVIANHPQSYYAWRSAVQLGWQVGDFSTVRQINPKIVSPPTRPILPLGSETLKELYQLGQDRDAWMLWQAEFTNRIKPTVTEEFTDGLLRIASGDYLEGISTIASLEDRETPQEKAEYEKLQKTPTYWYALYPLPFMDAIANYSKQHHLNPLLTIALIRQESRFESDIRSSAGAVGLMQMMPTTGELVAKNIKLAQYKLDNPNDNIKLGTWLLADLLQSHNNNSALAVASYNAGSGNTGQWLAGKGAIDTDEFVESIPFPETQDYVKQVFGNYWNYLRLYNPQIAAKIK
ncbi:lytic transglycosylase domain-containing protein [Limnofasciculus baicalensis]|uniref:Transglycosylase SLT domain-containing protein n=1 Tax=Limnofasciculus baicalensis BBK-W-15 TaxID=2699891 RepID=A0AAE3KM12_9CYAN|nr:transglycosylase SLT domain-containing protein [Limnofasciculus baicalensis]MCP2727213.1 transglycosylase SLT domain-containing protein [Limnofasciculus baicalensis BBK-W-15]